MTPTVTSSTAATPSAAAPAATTSATTGFGENFDSFLKLLTTQLQNQDPLSPLDTNQFTQQLVSFSQVEQAINTNTKLAALVSMQSANQLVSALPVVGKTIEFSGDTTALTTGSPARFSYTLGDAANGTVLTVLDKNNTVVWRGAGETGSGRHDFVWDGTGLDGASVPAGDYKLAVTATRADKSAVSVTQTAFGTVGSIQSQNNSTVLAVGDLTVPMSKLIAVRDKAN